MKRNRTLIFTIIGGVAVLFLFGRQLSKPRVVARAVAPNGIEFCMVQRLGEPFKTSAFYRKPGGPWGWFYYDHEDSFWIGGRTEIDLSEKMIKVYREEKLTATFAWESETFELIRFNRTTSSPHWQPRGRDPWD